MRDFRKILIALAVTVFVVAWVFPILWSVLNSLKTEQDILAYPPKFFFEPTLAAYRSVLFGTQSILPNVWSSIVISVGTTIITMVLAIPAAYALARLRADRTGGCRAPQRVVAERHDDVGAVVTRRDLIEHAADARWVLAEIGAIGLSHGVQSRQPAHSSGEPPLVR